MNFFTEQYDIYTCKECKQTRMNFPLQINHSKLCTTPLKMKIYKRDKLGELENMKFELECQIKELSRIRDKLLQNIGILDEGEKYIKDYIEAISFLS